MSATDEVRDDDHVGTHERAVAERADRLRELDEEIKKREMYMIQIRCEFDEQTKEREEHMNQRQREFDDQIKQREEAMLERIRELDDLRKTADVGKFDLVAQSLASEPPGKRDQADKWPQTMILERPTKWLCTKSPSNESASSRPAIAADETPPANADEVRTLLSAALNANLIDLSGSADSQQSQPADVDPYAVEGTQLP